jgi:hypothetical protein
LTGTTAGDDAPRSGCFVIPKAPTPPIIRRRKVDRSIAHPLISRMKFTVQFNPQDRSPLKMCNGTLVFARFFL